MSKEYPSTMIIFSPNGENEKVVFGTKKEMPKEIKKEKWVSTDAWRGFTEWELADGYVEIADGWITGFPDKSVERKVELADIFNDLINGEIVPPCNVYWLFGITSNVFSSASKVFVAVGDGEAIEEWLQKIDGGIEGLKEMMS